MSKLSCTDGSNSNNVPDSVNFSYLEYAGSVRSTPRIQQVVLSRADEPLSTVGELEGENAAVVEVQLVLVGFGMVQHFHVAALHPVQKIGNELVMN